MLLLKAHFYSSLHVPRTLQVIHRHKYRLTHWYRDKSTDAQCKETIKVTPLCMYTADIIRTSEAAQIHGCFCFTWSKTIYTALQWRKFHTERLCSATSHTIKVKTFHFILYFCYIAEHVLHTDDLWGCINKNIKISKMLNKVDMNN